MICDRCGRLLNRATGKCAVCADHGGDAPPPVATREAAAGPDADLSDAPSPASSAAAAEAALRRPPSRAAGGAGSSGSGSTGHEPPSRSVAATLRPAGPKPGASPYRLAPPLGAPVSRPPMPAPPGSPAPTSGAANVASPGDAPAPAPVPVPAPAPAPRAPEPEPDQPISVSAAVAILDLSDRPEKAARAASTTTAPSAPVDPPPPPRAPGAAVGVIRSARLGGRRKVDLVAYDGNLVLAKAGAPVNLMSGQLAAQDGSSRVLAAETVEEAIVREDAVSGQVRILLRGGESVVVRWLGWKNRGVSAENLFAHAFPGKVDQGSSEIVRRTVRLMMGLGVAILLAVAAYLGLSTLLKGDPPPPPPAAPPTTLPAAEQAARVELQAACPPWQMFAASVPAGDRPNPASMLPIVDGMHDHFVVAASAGGDPIYTAGRDELGYLQDYARRPVDVAARESVSRVAFAMNTVSSACARATSGS